MKKRYLLKESTIIAEYDNRKEARYDLERYSIDNPEKEYEIVEQEIKCH